MFCAGADLKVSNLIISFLESVCVCVCVCVQVNVLFRYVCDILDLH